MNVNELKSELIALGAKEEDLAKVDFNNIESIFDGADSVDELCKALKDTYPTFNEEEFKKAIAENPNDSDIAQNLSDEDLEAVAGGSVGSWLNKNKAWLIPVATIAVLGIGYGIYKKHQNNELAKAEKEFPEAAGKIRKIIKDSKTGEIKGYIADMDPIILD